MSARPVALALLVAAGPLAAQASAARVRVTVTVTDSAGAPIPSARVYVGNTDSARVDPAGRAVFAVAPGARAFWATSMGFAPLARRVVVTRDTAFVMVLAGAPDAAPPAPRPPIRRTPGGRETVDAGAPLDGRVVTAGGRVPLS